MSATDGPLRLSAVRIFVDDLGAAKKFYGDLLGLKLVSHDVNYGYMVFESGEVTLVVEVPNLDDPEESDLIGRFTGVSFETASVEALYTRLKRQKVKFACPPEEQPWGGVLTTCYDPFGNGITFVQYNKTKKKPAASTTSSRSKPVSGYESGMDALFALDQVEQKISNLEFRAAALANLSRDVEDREFRKQQTSAAVESDLQAIKQHVKNFKSESAGSGKTRLVVESKSKSDKKKRLLPAVINKKTTLPATTKKKR